jgi:hypothetical protein
MFSILFPPLQSLYYDTPFIHSQNRSVPPIWSTYGSCNMCHMACSSSLAVPPTFFSCNTPIPKPLGVYTFDPAVIVDRLKRCIRYVCLRYLALCAALVLVRYFTQYHFGCLSYSASRMHFSTTRLNSSSSWAHSLVEAMAA